MPAAPAILDHTGRPIRREQPARRPAARRIRASYDAAVTNDDNERHWANSDELSASAANSLEIRKVLRKRARYEAANNGYAQGLILTLANDLIGTGPTLQVLTANDQLNERIELEFGVWAEAVGLAASLRCMCQAKVRDGEAFAVFVTNDRVDSPVQLDLRLVEADMVTDPWSWRVDRDDWDDGIQYDGAGNPVAYTVLREHPGDRLAALPQEYDRLPARLVLHWFRKDRPGQRRGIPEITPSLPLFAQLRRFTLATLTAAETAADFSAMLQTDAPPDGADLLDPLDTVDIDKGLLVTLPAGWKLAQLAAEHPTTTYEMFKAEVLKEIGRPLGVPFNTMAGDSSRYNFSSARLDHLLYRRGIRIERDDCRRSVLDRVFRAWLEEAVMVPGLFGGLTPELIRQTWYWPGFEYMDPQVEEAANAQALANGTTNLKEILAEWGQDWEVIMRQRAREIKLAGELGLAPAPAAPAPAAEAPTEPEPEEEEEEAEEEDDEPASVVAINRMADLLAAFCPNGPGGGVDPSCAPAGGQGGGEKAAGGKGRAAPEKVREVRQRQGREQAAMETRHAAESDALESRHEKETNRLERKAAKEDRDAERARDKEDRQLERQDEREDAKAERDRDRRMEREIEEADGDEDKEQAAADRAAAEERAYEERADRERAERDRQIAERREREDAEREAAREKARAELAERHGREEEALTERLGREQEELDDRHAEEREAEGVPEDDDE